MSGSSIVSAVLKYGAQLDKESQQALLDEMSIAAARRDPSEFAGFCFVDKFGKPWQVKPFHREWNAIIPPYGTPGKVLIQAPHEHGKTGFLTIARVIWEIGTNPQIRIRILCSDDTLAESIIWELEQQIQFNPRIKRVFPNLQPATPWDKSKFTVVRNVILKDPTVQAESILGGSTGGRVDLLIADDVCTHRNTIMQPSLMPMVISAFQNVWINSVEIDGRVVVINTPWHIADNTAALEKDPSYVKWKKPARDPETGKYLWPEKFTPEVLREKKRTLGARNYARGFELKALAQEELTFGESCIFRDPALSWGGPVPENAVVIGALDPATSGQLVFLTIALDPVTHRRIPIEMIRSSHTDPVEGARRVVLSFLTYHHDVIAVENNATQATFMSLIGLVANSLPEPPPPLPLEPLFTGSQKMNLAVGLPSMSSALRQGKWPIPFACEGCGETPCVCHGPTHDCDSCEWIRELQTHPSGKQDIIMASWFCEQLARRIEFQESDDDLDVLNASLVKPEGSLLDREF
jgi:hypothetical protein